MNPYKILIIDDNQSVLRTLKLVLNGVFKTVVTVPDPQLIPALLQAGDVDVVLLDMYFESWYRSSCEILYEHGLKAAMVSRPCRLLDSAHRKDDYKLPAHPPYKQQNQHFAPWECTIPQRDAA